MANEQELNVDRRRALGMLGKASAVAAVAGVPTVTLAATPARGNGPRVVDDAIVRSEFGAGAGAIPLDAILPDGLARSALPRAQKLLDDRIEGVVEMLIAQQREKQPLIDGKHSMHRARQRVHDIILALGNGTVTAGEARVATRASFDVFFHEMQALGVTA